MATSRLGAHKLTHIPKCQGSPRTEGAIQLIPSFDDGRKPGFPFGGINQLESASTSWSLLHNCFSFRVLYTSLSQQSAWSERNTCTIFSWARSLLFRGWHGTEYLDRQVAVSAAAEPRGRTAGRDVCLFLEKWGRVTSC